MTEQRFPFSRHEGTIRKTTGCIMSAERKRRDESARRSESVRKEMGPKNNQRSKATKEKNNAQK